MKTLLKLLLFALLLSAAFGLGYLSSSRQFDALNRRLTELRSEMEDRLHLQEEIRSLRYKMHLLWLRDRLNSAREALELRNFGEAAKQIEKGRSELSKARPLSRPEHEVAIAGIEAELETIVVQLDRMDPRARDRIEEAKRDLDRLID
jgi:hypothetical protein